MLVNSSSKYFFKGLIGGGEDIPKIQGWTREYPPTCCRLLILGMPLTQNTLLWKIFDEGVGGWVDEWRSTWILLFLGPKVPYFWHPFAFTILCYLESLHLVNMYIYIHTYIRCFFVCVQPLTFLGVSTKAGFLFNFVI